MPAPITDQPPTRPLEVLMIGAGIGGLTAAAALRKSGHNIRISYISHLGLLATLNQRFSCEIGAAIHVGPNASRALAHLGYDPKLLQAVECRGATIHDPSGRIVMQTNTDWVKAAYGDPWLLTHRIDLHNELRRLALDEDLPGQAAALHLSSAVTAVDAEQATITLESGEVVKGDLVVASDGIYSKTREQVFGAGGLEPTGEMCYRFILNGEQIADDQECMPCLPEAGLLRIIIGQDRRIIIYPCRSAKLVNFVCIFPDNHGAVTAGNWNSKSSFEEVLKTYQGWDPSIIKLLAKAEDVSCWRLLQRPKLSSFVLGKFCLVGDAAHPMLPHQGQGGGQAIEDGTALGELFTENTRAEHVPALLSLYQKVRYDRAMTVLQLSRDAAVGMSNYDPGLVQQYNFGHDVVGFAKHARSSIFLP